MDTNLLDSTKPFAEKCFSNRMRTLNNQKVEYTSELEECCMIKCMKIDVFLHFEFQQVARFKILRN